MQHVRLCDELQEISVLPHDSAQASKGISAWTRAQVQAMSLHKHLSILSCVERGEERRSAGRLTCDGSELSGMATSMLSGRPCFRPGMTSTS